MQLLVIEPREKKLKEVKLMNDNKAVGLDYEEWPTYDLEQLLSTGCLTYTSDQSEMVISRANCGHYTIGIGSPDDTLIWHLDNIKDVMKNFAWVSFNTMKYLPREEFEVKGALTFVDVREGIANIVNGKRTPDLIASMIADIALQKVSDTLDRVLENLDEEDEEKEEIDL